MNPADNRPTSVTVFGVLNIVFASLGLLSLPMGAFGAFSAIKQPEIGASYGVWLILAQVGGLILNASLLTLGIGLLKTKSWARQGCVIYGCVALASAVFAFIVAVIFFGFILPPSKDPVFAAGLFGGFVGLVFALPYPILLIIFMQKQQMRQYFGN